MQLTETHLILKDESKVTTSVAPIHFLVFHSFPPNCSHPWKVIDCKWGWQYIWSNSSVGLVPATVIKKKPKTEYRVLFTHTLIHKHKHTMHNLHKKYQFGFCFSSYAKIKQTFRVSVSLEKKDNVNGFSC